MLNLFKTEFLRHWKLAIRLAAGHFLILYSLYHFMASPFIDAPTVQFWQMLLMVVAGGFGILQFLLHKRTNDWLDEAATRQKKHALPLKR